MALAFVIGNGVSRRGVDLAALRNFGPIYGCNALYRDFAPTVLVATDRPIATAIQESGYALANRFYTRRPIDGHGALKVPQEYYGYSSGPIALALAARDGARRIYFLGFDMGGVEGKFNNVYADTEFYKTSQASPTFTGNWCRQIRQIARDFHDREFVRVCGPHTASVSELADISNIKTVDLESFLHGINISKEL